MSEDKLIKIIEWTLITIGYTFLAFIIFNLSYMLYKLLTT